MVAARVTAVARRFSCEATSGQSLDTVITVMNAVFSVIFLADFIYRVVTAPSPGGYDFKHFGWADILASLPFEQCNPPCRWPACPRPAAHRRRLVCETSQ